MNWSDYTKRMEKRGAEEVKRFLEYRTDMVVLRSTPFECEAGRAEMVAWDKERGIVLVSITVKGDGPQNWGAEARERMERVAQAFLEASPETASKLGTRVCFDLADVKGVADDLAGRGKAKVVYHRDYLNRRANA